MFAICISKFGSAVPKSERLLGETDETDYSPLRVGEGYAVYGLLHFCDRVDFLVGLPEQVPFWVPSSLFDLADASLPNGWEFCFTRSRKDYEALADVFKIKCIVGYPLLVNDYQHYVGLIEKDPKELRRFIEENNLQTH